MSDPGRTTRRRRAQMFAAGSMILIVVGYAWDLHRRDDYINAVWLRRDMRESRLIGASPQVVISFLDRENLSHSAFDASARSMTADYYGGMTFTLAGPLQWEVGISFSFDEHERLKSYAIDPVATGL